MEQTRLLGSGPGLYSHSRRPMARPPSFAPREPATLLSQAQSKVVPYPHVSVSRKGDVGNTSRYAAGNFTPVRELEGGATTNGFVVLEGKIPESLRGLFIMNGPNPDRNPNGGKYHLFDGDGMVHAVHFGEARLTYKNKFVDTLGRKVENFLSPCTRDSIYPGINEALNDIPKIAAMSFLSKAAPAWFFGLGQDAGTWGDTPLPVLCKNVANTNLVYHHGKLLALWEAGYPYELNPMTMETVQPYTFKGKLNSSFTAHPKIDPVNGQMVDVSYSFPQAPHARVRVWNVEGDLIHEMTIKDMDAVLMHDCAITERYTLILDLPLLFNSPFGMGAAKGVNAAKSMSFKPERGGRIGVVPRFGVEKDIKWFKVSPNFAFHTFNAREEGDQIILHASRLDSVPGWDPISDGFGGKKLLFEYTLDMSTGESKERAACCSGQSVDMPCIHPRFLGRRAKYVFVGGDPHPEDYHPISSCEKVDLLSDTPPHVYSLPERCYVASFAFAPRPSFCKEVGVGEEGSDGSDDGWLLIVLYSEVTGFSELHVVDGRNMKLVARVHLPSRVPYGFHSIFIPEENLPKPYLLA